MTADPPTSTGCATTAAAGWREGGADDRHRGRQQPAGAEDRAARRLSGNVRPDASQEACCDTPPGRHVRPPNVSRCRHARATPQPVASAATLPRARRSRASKPATPAHESRQHFRRCQRPPRKSPGQSKVLLMPSRAHVVLSFPPASFPPFERELVREWLPRWRAEGPQGHEANSAVRVSRIGVCCPYCQLVVAVGDFQHYPFAFRVTHAIGHATNVFGHLQPSCGTRCHGHR